MKNFVQDPIIMNLRMPHSAQINLQSNRFEEPLNVNMDAFLEFSFWISEELLRLENRFAADCRSPVPAKVKH